MLKNFMFTSESVTGGHPDKVADQISDAVLDSILEVDKNAKVACETLVTTGQVVIAGEIGRENSARSKDLIEVIRSTIKEIGYNDSETGFHYKSCGILNALHEQSKDIRRGVVKKGKKAKSGAGDQGLMFGYACTETKELMPMPIMLAHRLAMKLRDVRENGTLKYLRPDGKSQATVKYINGKPISVTSIVIAAQHTAETNTNKLRRDIEEAVIREVIPESMMTKETELFINQTGRFVTGGPDGDTGLTGRKIIVDSYGGKGRHGGGCFSGKDPSKVDRSACYMARYIAKNIVAANLATECEVQLAYVIGHHEPVSIMVNTFGTGRIYDQKLEMMIKEYFATEPDRIISMLDLRRPIYKKTAAYGHFGREEKEFTWEKTDKAELLKKEACL